MKIPMIKSEWAQGLADQGRGLLDVVLNEDLREKMSLLTFLSTNLMLSPN